MKFNRLMFFICIAIILFVLILTLYKSEILHEGLIRSHYLNYYIFSIFSLILLFIINLFNKKIVTNFYILLISSMVGITLFETFLEFKIQNFFLKERNVVFKNPYKYVINEKDKKDFFPRILPGALLPSGIDNKIFPSSSHSLKKTIMCKEGSGLITYLSDRYGFNNDDDVWDKKIQATLIGDSFVHGDCVKRDHTIANNLIDLTNLNFLNLGMGGNGPLLKLLSLREFGFLKETKQILWFYFEGNDFIELEFEKSSKILKNYLNNQQFSQNLYKKTKLIDNHLITIHNRNLEKSKFPYSLITRVKSIIFFKNIRQLIRNILSKKNKNLKFDITTYEKIMKNARDFSKRNGAEFYFIYLPMYERFSNSKINHANFRKKNLIISTMLNNDIRVIDISHLVFEKNDDPLQFFPNRLPGHYNEKGYKAVSDKLKSTLYKN